MSLSDCRKGGLRAHSADAGLLAPAIATALRSDEMPLFGEIVSRVFASAADEQKMAMLALLLSAATPELRTKLNATVRGLDIAAGLVAADGLAAITPTTVRVVAELVEEQDSSVIDRMSGLFASHPALVSAMGSEALAVVVRTIAEHCRSDQRTKE